MRYSSFEQIDKSFDELFEQERFEEALNIVDTGLKTLPMKELEEHFFTLMYIKAYLYTRLDRYDECYETIENAVGQGYAFPLHFDRYESLKQKKGYMALEEQNNKLLAELRSEAIYEVHLPKDYNPQRKYPLFMALHGDGLCSIGEFSKYWKPDVFLAEDIIFAYVQSSQAICYNGFGWLKDQKTSRRDIKVCCEKIAEKYSIDEGSILIGGYSGGASTSVDFTMSHTLPIRGFIALCPEEKTDAFTRENAERAAKNGVRGVFMEGELSMPVKSEEEMLRTFEEVGLPCKYYINKGIGHAAPDDFDEKLKQALRFIFN